MHFLSNARHGSPYQLWALVLAVGETQWDEITRGKITPGHLFRDVSLSVTLAKSIFAASVTSFLHWENLVSVLGCWDVVKYREEL